MSIIFNSGVSSRFSPIALALSCYLFTGNTWAENIESNAQGSSGEADFDASFLNIEDSEKVDLSRFKNGSSGTPGVYKTYLYVNNELITNTDIEFRSREDKSVYPCITSEIIKNISFDYSKLPSDFLKNIDGCMDLKTSIPEVNVAYDSNEQRLDVIVPQLYMQKIARGTVSSELWDSGVPVMMLGYDINGYSSDSQGKTFNSLYAGLNAGFNVDAWYLRHNGSYTNMSNGSQEYNSINTYIQRDIPALRSRALLGQSNTTGDLFDTLPFTGVQLSTDERMLPESQRGYAPEIRGVARTNARVSVQQGGVTIYETTVSPGAFLINDLYPTGYGGDLDVIIRESDGSEQTFKVPYAAVTQLLRPGSSRYSITAGEYRAENVGEKPMLYQATYHYGLNNAVTAFGGLQYSENYYAMQLGSALGTSYGAVAISVTQAKTTLNNEGENSNSSYSGQSYELSYSKLISETNSNLSLAAYRFSTEGYFDFTTAMQTRKAIADGQDEDIVSRAKNRLTLTVGQGLPLNAGQLYVSGSIQDYWNKQGKDTQYQLGYTNQYKQISYGVTANRTFSSLGASQTNYMLSISFPLGNEGSRNRPQLRTDLSHDTSGRMGQQLSISGTGGDENQYSYGATVMNANQGVGTSGTVNGNYLSPVTSMSGSLGTSKDFKSISGGFGGTLVAHSGGIALSPYTSDTFALVEAKGAEGASVSSYPGVRVDSRGYALVPYLNPYQMNEISIDPKGMSDEVELSNTSQKIAPYSGAVVKMKYDTKRGTPVLINATWKNEPVPFGASVSDSNGTTVGAVGQAGQIYARVSDERGKLVVKWGDDDSSTCGINYQLIPIDKKSGNLPLQKFNLTCE